MSKYFQEGGPIALIENGDMITIDIRERRMDVLLTDEEMAERRKKWTPPPGKADKGVLYKVCENWLKYRSPVVDVFSKVEYFVSFLVSSTSRMCNRLQRAVLLTSRHQGESLERHRVNQRAQLNKAMTRVLHCGSVGYLSRFFCSFFPSRSFVVLCFRDY